jgi:hypothetical protein
LSSAFVVAVVVVAVVVVAVVVVGVVVVGGGLRRSSRWQWKS